ncbi:MAG: hypothetical protein GC183_04505 [Thiobacillus sp.]|nr:hypothetical protein [Thiobacillus sp.]
MSTSLIVAAGLSPFLLLESHGTDAAHWKTTRAGCPVASTLSVPAEHLDGDARVAPLSGLSDKATVLASCPPRKVIRT